LSGCGLANFAPVFGMNNPPASLPEVRIDKWLWAVRLYKTRSLAAEACRGGHVSIARRHVKPSHTLRGDEIISARTGELNRIVRVTGLIEKRVGAKEVAGYLEDQTPASEYLRVLELKHQPAIPKRPKGAGRPTKKERRALELLE
jgi:ribosome-associated heat shock protein Hsp15